MSVGNHYAESNSSEMVDDAQDPVVIYMPEISRTHMGGTMRLGLRPTVFQPDTEWASIRQLYGGPSKIWERHRHRYEVNPAYVSRIEESGMQFIGRDEKGERMQVMQLRGNDFCARAMFIIILTTAGR
jgi:CTP synthase